MIAFMQNIVFNNPFDFVSGSATFKFNLWLKPIFSKIEVQSNRIPQ